CRGGTSAAPAAPSCSGETCHRYAAFAVGARGRYNLPRILLFKPLSATNVADSGQKEQPGTSKLRSAHECATIARARAVPRAARQRTNRTHIGQPDIANDITRNRPA